jgi:DNA-binding LacI/PurR family transcriptional regulator
MAEGNPRASARATMKDVASEAGVSAQTVSNLINGRYGQMSPSTRARVEAAMRKLGYHPHGTAQGLRSARTRTLGFLVLDDHAGFLADPLTGLLMAGVGDVVRARRFGLLVQGARPGSDPEALLAPILERRIDGAFMLLSGASDVRRSYVERLLELAVSFVVFDEILPDTRALSVRAAERAGGRQLTQHLLGKGHRRIAFIAARVPWAVVEQRFLGYRDALALGDMDPAPELELFEGSWHPGGGQAMATKLLSRSDPPTAIIGGSDLLALAAMRAARLLGLRVPDDVAVAGFDDFPFSALVEPPLTTVAVPAYEMGHAAAETLLQRLDGEQPSRRELVLDVELRVRESA